MKPSFPFGLWILFKIVLRETLNKSLSFVTDPESKKTLLIYKNPFGIVSPK